MYLTGLGFFFSTPKKVNQSMSDRALDGLKQVMSVKSKVVLPYLVPQVRNSFPGNIVFVSLVSLFSLINFCMKVHFFDKEKWDHAQFC